jgi:hypothetical protein
MSEMVSHMEFNTEDLANKIIEFKKQLEKGYKKQARPTDQLPSMELPISNKPFDATGKSNRVYSSSPTHLLKKSLPPQLHGILEEDVINSTQSLARASKNDTTNYTSSTSNMPMGMNITKCHELVLSMLPDTPPPYLTMDFSSSDQMNYSTATSELGTNADGEQDMEIDKTAEVEWEVLRKDIQDELAQDAAQLEELKKEKEQEENKENDEHTSKVELDIYDRLCYAYEQSAGQPPTNEVMIQL